ncbi:hypothetical protein FHL15_000517 [Xylaria flabelliformis]|uniref:Uncharacterized protein n=1 Tax=Xylaria flabelliformis TaxID=2512241 RepID=A0A553IE30_9PEZI|nr:hypothetical protein FHL15_000517 [Xylaria flabelliformis]
MKPSNYGSQERCSGKGQQKLSENHSRRYYNSGECTSEKVDCIPKSPSLGQWEKSGRRHLSTLVGSPESGGTRHGYGQNGGVFWLSTSHKGGLAVDAHHPVQNSCLDLSTSPRLSWTGWGARRRGADETGGDGGINSGGVVALSRRTGGTQGRGVAGPKRYRENWAPQSGAIFQRFGEAVHP